MRRRARLPESRIPILRLNRSSGTIGCSALWSALPLLLAAFACGYGFGPQQPSGRKGPRYENRRSHPHLSCTRGSLADSLGSRSSPCQPLRRLSSPRRPLREFRGAGRPELPRLVDRLRHRRDPGSRWRGGDRASTRPPARHLAPVARTRAAGRNPACAGVGLVAAARTLDLLSIRDIVLGQMTRPQGGRRLPAFPTSSTICLRLLVVAAAETERCSSLRAWR